MFATGAALELVTIKGVSSVVSGASASVSASGIAADSALAEEALRPPAAVPAFVLTTAALPDAGTRFTFVASVLPVWMLLCPRDYLSSYMKIGTIALLAIGVIVVNPKIQMPGVTPFIHGGGPIVKGPLFPFVFITIACGAISGFHGLVASGTS